MIKLSQLKNFNCVLDYSHNLSENELTISTDSRTYLDEEVFVAISGDNFNAFEYIESVLAKGCRNIVFTANKKNQNLLIQYVKNYTSINFIAVTDSIHFLQEVATNISNKFQQMGKKLICISGSNGKTTTKEMIFHILKELEKNVICTQKNNNNHIGVPLTLLQINKNTEYAIVEFGSNHPGEIKVLCDIANPSIGITTNIGYTHMEFFPTLADVFQEEAYLLDFINKKENSEQRILFINKDDDLLKNMELNKSSVTFGTNAKDLDYSFEIAESKATISYAGGSYEVDNSNLTGQHNFYNLCVSVAVVHKTSQISLEKIIKAAQNFTPTKNRSEWTQIDNTQIFLDAYNANPSSMRTALVGFKSRLLKNEINLKDACAILGDMNELGDHTAKFHLELGEFASQLGFGKVVFVGRYASHYIAHVAEGDAISTYSSTKDLKEIFQQMYLNKFEYIFIKGSRSLQLESLIDIT